MQRIKFLTNLFCLFWIFLFASRLSFFLNTWASNSLPRRLSLLYSPFTHKIFLTYLSVCNAAKQVYAAKLADILQPPRPEIQFNIKYKTVSTPNCDSSYNYISLTSPLRTRTGCRMAQEVR